MSIRKKPDLTNDEAYIINTFKQLRRYRGISQDELAKRTGISKALVAQLEAGWKHPRFELVKKLTNAIDKDFFTSYLQSYFEEPTKRLIKNIDFGIPLLSSVAVNAEDIAKKKYDDIPVYSDLAGQLKNIPNLYALIMPDNSLANYALIRRRDYLIIKYVKIDSQKDIDNLPDNIVGAFVNQKTGYIKKLRLMNAGGKKLFMLDMRLYDGMEILTLEKMKDLRGIVIATVRFSMLDDITLALFTNPDIFYK
jgi:transcriptional regulator with XRE-family HTH domain